MTALPFTLDPASCAAVPQPGINDVLELLNNSEQDGAITGAYHVYAPVDAITPAYCGRFDKLGVAVARKVAPCR